MITLVEISEDLKEIVSSTIESVREGLKGKECAVVGTIKFELAVIKTKKGGAGISFIIADASGKYSKESISRIEFQVIGRKTAHGHSKLAWLYE